MKNSKLTIGIVGGRGEMGCALADFFRRQGFSEDQILISGRNPDGKKILSNAELVKKADVVIVSVFLKDSVRVIEELAPLLREEQLFLDVSSIKNPQVAAMLKSKAEVLGTHPMFGGNISLTGQVVVVCPVRVKTWKNWFEDLLKQEGVKIVELTPEEHDRRMPIVQALPHFLGFTFSEVLRESGFEFAQIKEVATPNAKIWLDLASRIISQDSNLVFEIQKANPNNAAALEKLTTAVKEWRELISTGDTQKFEQRLSASKTFFGDFLEDGKAESQLFLDTIARRSLKIEEQKKPRGGTRGASETAQIPTAIFGGEGSNTDDAARRFFENIEKKGDVRFYTDSIQSAFTAVKKGKARNAVVPFENETGGIIRETFEQLFKFTGEIKIDTLVDLEIHHALATSVTTDAAEIRTIYSHPQALTQCAQNLQKNYPSAEGISTKSTVEAFEKIQKLRNSAAIGPLKKAKELGLKILEENFEDQIGENVTTFAVITKRFEPRQNATHTLAAFFFPVNKPGQLVEVLKIFQDAAINLSRILSIGHSIPGEYIFFIEFEGCLGEEKIESAFAKAKKLATLYDFGSYRKI